MVEDGRPDATIRLDSHGRGHWFNPSNAHQDKDIRMRNYEISIEKPVRPDAVCLGYRVWS